jgi:hypothetical protein
MLIGTKAVTTYRRLVFRSRIRGAIPPFSFLSVVVVLSCSVYICYLKNNVSCIAGLGDLTKENSERVITYIQNFNQIVVFSIPCHGGAGTLLC